MKAKYIGLSVALLIGAFTSCQDKDWGIPENILDNPPFGNNEIAKSSSPYKVAQLKRQYTDIIENSGYEEITEDLQLQVIVNGNDAGGNIYKQISVQDETGGIIIGVNATELGAYLPVGQKLLINLKGLYIGGYGKQAQIGALYNGSIGRMTSTEWEKHIRLVKDDMFDCLVDTVDFDINADKLNLTGRIVKISSCTISGGGKQVLAPDDGSVALTSNCANRNINGSSKAVLRTSTYSDFANRAIPMGKCDLYGVCTRFNDTWQILMRTEDDLRELDGRIIE